jgi:hypothetical protein
MKHRQNYYRTAAGFVSLSGLVLGLVLADQVEPRLAIAGGGEKDDKVFAPQFCVPIDKNDHSIDAKHAEFHKNRVEPRENGNDTQLFICPLVRDIIKGELERVFVRLDVEDENQQKNNSDDTKCCVFTFDPLGEDSESECEEPDEEGLQSLEIDGPDTEDNGYFLVTCELNEGDSIRSIRTMEEKDNN